jgi:hypothetical protein
MRYQGFFPSFPCCYVLERPVDLRNSKQVSHCGRRTCTEIRQAIQILWEIRTSGPLQGTLPQHPILLRSPMTFGLSHPEICLTCPL